MVELLAASFRDGWGFVRRDDEIRVIKPPYRRANATVVSLDTVEKAVHAYGFEARSERFDDWRALIAFLRERLLASRNPQQPTLSTEERLQELMQDAPGGILSTYLDRVESELIPNREWHAATRLLAAILASETASQEAGLRGRAAALLTRCMDARIEAESEMQELLDPDLDQMSPHAVRKFGATAIRECARQISVRHQVLALCA